MAEIEYRNFRRGARCRHCSRDRSVKTNAAHHDGTFHFQTEQFKSARKRKFIEHYGVDSPLKSDAIKRKRENTNLNKYGVKSVSQVPEIYERQKAAMKARHGYEYTMQIPAVKEKYKATMMERYGVPNMAYLSRCASKQSQKLFLEVHHRLPPHLQNKSHFAELNAEFVVAYNGNYYKYDFVNSVNKVCIEYNGKKFHPTPEQSEDETGWCVFHPNKTVREARQYETNKLTAIGIRGYRTLVVWDIEYHNDFNALVEKCVMFIMQDNQP